MIGLAAIGLFLLVAVVLLLADRSGSIVGDLRPVVIDTGRRVELALDVDVLNHQDIPGTADQIGHAALWGAGMALFGWIARYRVPIPLTALFTAAVSLAFEASQPVLSSTRAFDPADAVGNMAGIAGAAVLLGAALSVQRRMFGDDRAMQRRS